MENCLASTIFKTSLEMMITINNDVRDIFNNFLYKISSARLKNKELLSRHTIYATSNWRDEFHFNNIACCTATWSICFILWNDSIYNFLQFVVQQHHRYHHILILSLVCSVPFSLRAAEYWNAWINCQAEIAMIWNWQTKFCVELYMCTGLWRISHRRIQKHV